MAAPASQSRLPRYHSLDSLRAIMMLLGLVLHASINYLPFIHADANWAYQDAQTHSFFSWLLVFIHIFRMPTFFFIAGFFAAFLLATRGTRGFLRHRMNRIGIPLVCAWLVIYPLTVVCMRYARARSAASPLPELDFSPSLLHFWFLYHLLIFCVVAVLAVHLLQYLGPCAIAPSRPSPAPSPCTGHGRAGRGKQPRGLSDAGRPLRYHHFLRAAVVHPGRVRTVLRRGVAGVSRREILEQFKPRAWRYFAAGFVSHGFFLFFYSQG